MGNLPFVTLEIGESEEAFDASFFEVPGFALITQTCDVLRREEVQIAALTLLSAQDLELVRRRRIPRLAYLPQLSEHSMAVDLDRVMTVHKGVLERATKIAWDLQDSDRRLFAGALARHKERFAFPDDFVAGMQPLRNRLGDKKRKATSEGRLINAAGELRVAAMPSWDAKNVELTLYCVLAEDAHANDRADWLEIVKKWAGACNLPPRMKFDGTILCTYQEMTAADYLGSDKLDLDFMSS